MRIKILLVCLTKNSKFHDTQVSLLFMAAHLELFCRALMLSCEGVELHKIALVKVSRQKK